ncbi:hypothetical protein [Streptomyces sp. TR06-5]|uniref:hypothetical protein n=1 Tax=unclassified Streptomyces TaxID=2593676 RepID=UPI0039A39E2F
MAAEPLDRAEETVTGLLGAGRVEVVEGGLDLSVGAERAAEINALLVREGVAVGELRTKERDLEQVFFELTGEVTGHVG